MFPNFTEIIKSLNNQEHNNFSNQFLDNSIQANSDLKIKLISS